MKIFFALIVLCLTGCTYTNYREGSASFTRISLGTSQTIGDVTATVGDRNLTIRNYSNEQTKVALEALRAAQQLKLP